MKYLKSQTIKEKGLVDSRDVNMHYLYDQAEIAGDVESYQELMDELYHRMNEDSVFLNVFPHHSSISLVA
jgi:truncated hemoglobin YjbI